MARAIDSVIYEWDKKKYPANIQVLEKHFHSRIVSQHKLTKYYEDKDLQLQARELIPVCELQDNAAINFALYDSSEEDKAKIPIVDENYFFLLELLHWFKNSFFSWVDTPTCPFCQIPTQHNGSQQPSEEDLLWGASRVESYECPVCKRPQRFPRYNHPGKLLTERKGRCGEWANCFTLCCRSVGFEARFVLEWTDHVWTEVYSRAHERWLHCDPCEDSCDAPLLYEVGWKKTLSYVMAFSREQVVDVTWRYSRDHPAVLSRRTLCREGWLLDTLGNLNGKLRDRMTDAKKVEVTNRTVTELVEFLCPKTEVKEEELTGRNSGSLAWRLARRETHVTDQGEGSVRWKVTDAEMKAGTLHVVFNTASDSYMRMSSNREVVKGWRHGVSECENVFRYVENDWKMTYLSRTQGSEVGSVTWTFDLTGTASGVGSIQLKCENCTFEDGEVTWTLGGENSQEPIKIVGSQFVTTTSLVNERIVWLTAKMKGGRGNVAWQHAQLFRQPINALDEYPFEIIITFA